MTCICEVSTSHHTHPLRTCLDTVCEVLTHVKHDVYQNSPLEEFENTFCFGNPDCIDHIANMSEYILSILSMDTIPKQHQFQVEI